MINNQCCKCTVVIHNCFESRAECKKFSTVWNLCLREIFVLLEFTVAYTNLSLKNNRPAYRSCPALCNVHLGEILQYISGLQKYK